MKTYVDANSLIRLYLDFDGSGQARDLLHVASARALGCSRFLTFDTKARKLAQLVGLKTD